MVTFYPHVNEPKAAWFLHLGSWRVGVRDCDHFSTRLDDYKPNQQIAPDNACQTLILQGGDHSVTTKMNFPDSSWYLIMDENVKWLQQTQPSCKLVFCFLSFKIKKLKQIFKIFPSVPSSLNVPDKIKSITYEVHWSENKSKNKMMCSKYQQVSSK